MGTKTVQSTAVRGIYDEILKVNSSDGTVLLPDVILSRFADALPERFVDFDSKKRGDALSIDLYGVSYDHAVAVVQIRHAFRPYANGFLNLHKDYVLVGLNPESGTTFRHPVSAHAVRAGIRRSRPDAAAAVLAAQKWMWGVNESQLASGRRQGDILLVPARGRPAGSIDIDEEVVVVGGSHEVRARRFCRSVRGVIYAKAPTLRHMKRQHEPLYADNDHWFSVRVGREAAAWSWGERLGD